MSLKIRLKPHEKILIGGAVVLNGDKNSEIIIENNVPILREKDIMREEGATSPGRRVYFLVQLMYVDSENLVNYHHGYWELVKDILTAAPSTKPLIEEISNHLLEMDYYSALKASKKLISYETKLLEKVTGMSRGSGNVNS